MKTNPFFKDPDYLLFIAIIIIATALRLYMLDTRPFHHDESAVGSFTYKLFNNGEYEYTPVFHGPFIYFLTSGIFHLIGDTIFSARLLPALTGVGMVLLTYPFRNYLDRPDWLIATTFFTLSPSFLYYSRFFRNDIFITFFTFATIIYTAKYLENQDRPRRLIYLALGSASLGFSVTAKENAYVIIAMLV
ncbi:MAG TPA: flippase activity-associated protein Agl23, partial [Candidatus Nanoarchaeia archaeon]|nr:flippase activity-associated protein Agl23 [Candidatus Nanoarchaeia archaeon]